MMTIYIYLSRIFSLATLITLLGGLLVPSVSISEISDVPILQPGAPGKATREIDAIDALTHHRLEKLYDNLKEIAASLRD